MKLLLSICVSAGLAIIYVNVDDAGVLHALLASSLVSAQGARGANSVSKRSFLFDWHYCAFQSQVCTAISPTELLYICREPKQRHKRKQRTLPECLGSTEVSGAQNILWASLLHGGRSHGADARVRPVLVRGILTDCHQQPCRASAVCCSSHRCKKPVRATEAEHATCIIFGTLSGSLQLNHSCQHPGYTPYAV